MAFTLAFDSEFSSLLRWQHNLKPF